MKRLSLALLVAAGLAAATLASAAPALAAPWCGTLGAGNRPAGVAGFQIRVVYAVAADGEDRSAAVAPQLSADVDAVEEWWRREDQTRVPRFDRVAFPCGLQADIQLHRSTFSAETLRVAEESWSRLAEEVVALDGLAPFFKYLVYYDGPLDTDQICGEAGGVYDGPGVAVVYTANCAGEPTAATAAHELIHALGQAGAGPGACPGDPFHACDSSTDIMGPFAQEIPFASYALDVGRNDYYGHSGSWVDLQDTRYLRRLDSQVTLGLALAGAGSVTSDVPGVACTITCTTEWNAGEAVGLEAEPAEGQKFVGWTGACTDVSPSCFLRLDQATSVTAKFAAERYRLRVAVAGRGTVRVGPGQTVCPPRCAVDLPSYAATRIVATASSGWRFKSWTGACRGTRPACVVQMRRAASARALFVRAKPR